ncbi:MAG: type II toxin-antitoxin system VapC family toxin [Anaerolineae bacterium]|nr:type II toxin-antitoxin system VapC family toxin [Anaerolineae bacterium]
MNKVVIDSSIALKWFFPEPDSVRARSLLRDYQLGRLLILSPDLIVSELTNAVWWRQMNRKLAAWDGRAVLETFHALRMTLVPSIELMDQAYWLATMTQQSVYDSLYVALARREKCHFLTADEQFAHAVRKVIPEVMDLSVWMKSADTRKR